MNKFNFYVVCKGFSNGPWPGTTTYIGVVEALQINYASYYACIVNLHDIIFANTLLTCRTYSYQSMAPGEGGKPPSTSILKILLRVSLFQG